MTTISRRDALKMMGAGALAAVAGASGVGALISSCSSPLKEETKAGVLPEDVQADLEFTRNWTEKFIEGLDNEMATAREGNVNLKEAMRCCSRVCYDKNGFDKIIPENDFEEFLRIAKNDFKWGLDYDRKSGVLVVHENNAECLCPMVRACKDKMKPTLCHCTETELERMFSRAYGKSVKATVTESILKGQDTCVYRIELSNLT